MALSTQNYMSRPGSIVQYGDPYSIPHDSGFPTELLARVRYLSRLPTPDPKLEPKPTPDLRVRLKTDNDNDERRRKPQLYYVTYTKVDLDTGELYAGRARGLVVASVLKIGDFLPLTYVREGRDGQKHHTGERFGPLVIENVARTTKPVGHRWDDPAYQAIRGREQQLIDSQGGAWSDVGRENTNSGNKIRAVAADKI